MMNISYVLSVIRPSEEWSMLNEDYDTLIWHSDTVKPSLEEIETAWGTLELEWRLLPVRSKRDMLLAKSDWTQMPDAPVDKSVWAEYRQELRDLPENTVDPENPVWPTPPA